MDILKSKKFRAVLLGTALLVLTNLLNVPEQKAKMITDSLEWLFGFFIGGQTAVDVAAVLKGTKAG